MDDGGDDRLGRVQSLVRAFGILDELATADTGMTLTRIAGLVKLPRSTAHRLLTTMSSLQYVEFDGRTNLWHVGIRAFKVGSAFSQAKDLGRLGRPIMRSLMLDAHETVSIAVPGAGEVRYVGQLRADDGGPTTARPGVSLPMHTTASGKAMLSLWRPDKLDRFLEQQPLVRRTDASITDPGRLFAELDRIRQRGYAVDDEENADAVRCIAAPVLDSRGRPRASLSISGSPLRLVDDRLHGLGRSLAVAAQRMSVDLGDVLAA